MYTHPNTCTKEITCKEAIAVQCLPMCVTMTYRDYKHNTVNNYLLIQAYLLFVCINIYIRKNTFICICLGLPRYNLYIPF